MFMYTLEASKKLTYFDPNFWFKLPCHFQIQLFFNHFRFYCANCMRFNAKKKFLFTKIIFANFHMNTANYSPKSMNCCQYFIWMQRDSFTSLYNSNNKRYDFDIFIYYFFFSFSKYMYEKCTCTWKWVVQCLHKIRKTFCESSDFIDTHFSHQNVSLDFLIVSIECRMKK